MDMKKTTNLEFEVTREVNTMKKFWKIILGSHPGSALLVLTEGEHGALVQEMPLYASGCYMK